MEFGLFSNNRRPDRPIGEAWNEDIYEAEVADRLGFNEIWFSEHQSPAELIICKAAGRTERAKRCLEVRRELCLHHAVADGRGSGPDCRECDFVGSLEQREFRG